VTDRDLILLPAPVADPFGGWRYQTAKHRFIASFEAHGPTKRLAIVSISRLDNGAIVDVDRAELRRVAAKLRWFEESEETARGARAAAQALGAVLVPNFKLMAIVVTCTYVPNTPGVDSARRDVPGRD